MPRIIKHPEQRRGEILDCAQALFLQHGYDNASLNDVIAAAGLSKGAFYHYFASKEALLESLAERFAQHALTQIERMDTSDLDALSRLNAFLARGRQNKMENAEIAWGLFEALFKPENFILFHRVTAATSALVAPVLADLIRRGVEDGTFKTFDPEGVADMMMQLSTATHDMVVRALAASTARQLDDAINAFDQRIKLYEIALDRILGLPDGSVRMAEPGYMRALFMARTQSGKRRATKKQQTSRRS
ncbi:TetR/AcrR family transcriptional regulator [Bradyrhizobium sp. SYSU BS000235]|uniref:TetR/AcrR family transcriptional regulator n=1 Tax=Bradyrhizobium sp. SYSU BS000235 TaxID=3411332 RepID=UPI003C77C573